MLFWHEREEYPVVIQNQGLIAEDRRLVKLSRTYGKIEHDIELLVYKEDLEDETEIQDVHKTT